MEKNEYFIYSDKICSNKNIVVCSDIHIEENMPNDTLREIVNELEKINPTHIVIPGDLYEVDYESVHTYRVKNFIDCLTNIAEVFYVSGDSEKYTLAKGLDKNFNDRFHVLGEQPIFNEKIVIDNDVSISGVVLSQNFYQLSKKQKIKMLLTQYKEYLEELSKLAGDHRYNILLCHDPIVGGAIMEWGNIYHEYFNFDLILSGQDKGYINKAYGFELDKYAIVSDGITKPCSKSGFAKRLKKNHKGTIENIKIVK